MRNALKHSAFRDDHEVANPRSPTRISTGLHLEVPRSCTPWLVRRVRGGTAIAAMRATALRGERARITCIPLASNAHRQDHLPCWSSTGRFGCPVQPLSAGRQRADVDAAAVLFSDLKRSRCGRRADSVAGRAARHTATMRLYEPEVVEARGDVGVTCRVAATPE